jgi:hypothetical protein
MALVNPNIAMSFRQPEFQAPNALAQYAQIQQIQSGRQAQELAQLQMQNFQREQESTNALNRAYADAYNPQTGEIDVNRLRGSLSTGGFGSKLPAIEKSLGELAQQKLTQEKLKGEVAAQPTTLAAAQAKLLDDKLKQSRGFLETIDPTSPGAADAYMQWHRANHADPVIGRALEARGITVDQSMQRIQQLMQTPGGLARLINESKLGTEKFMELNKPQLSTKDSGSEIIDRTFQPLTGQITEVGRTTKTPTIGERTAQGQLNLAQQKFAFEKANPTMSIQEDPSGLLAVNTLTGVATPVVYGPNGIQAAPVAPAAAPGAGMPGPRLPAPTTQAIPGMTSVLDQAAAPARMPMPAVDGARAPGTPVRGMKDAPAKFNDTDMQLSGLAGSLKEFKDEVKKNMFTGARFTPTGADTARMQAKYTALLMGVKDLYTLGALTGPDMSIIESQLTNPASWSGKFTTQKGFEEQIKVIEDMLKRTAGNLENTYNRPPRATKKAIEALDSGGGEWSVVR